MLALVSLVADFNAVERALPDDWADARLEVTIADDARCDRAAALLGPASPVRRDKKIRFSAARRGAGLAPEAVRRLLRRLDAEGIRGDLQLVRLVEAPAAETQTRPSLRDAWERALSELPADWSDLYAEARLDSTDYLERGALFLSPLNPARAGEPNILRFRCARRFGYGVAPDVAARCFARCDDEGLTGAVRILRVLSDTDPVGTQGPVWYVAGRPV